MTLYSLMLLFYNKYFQNSWTIKPIGFKVIKNIRVKDNGPSVPGSQSLWSIMRHKDKAPEFYELDYKQIRTNFPDMDFITVSQNKDRPFNELSVLKKKLNWLFVECKKREWMGHNFYKSKLFVKDDEKRLKEIENKWSQQHIAYVNELAEKCKEEEEEDSSLEEITIDEDLI